MQAISRIQVGQKNIRDGCQNMKVFAPWKKRQERKDGGHMRPVGQAVQMPGPTFSQHAHKGSEKGGKGPGTFNIWIESQKGRVE